MSLGSEWLEFKQRLHTMRKQGGVKSRSRTGPRAKHIDRILARLESGLYPVCEACGERIEIDRLRVNALETKCWACATRPRSRAGKTTARPKAAANRRKTALALECPECSKPVRIAVRDQVAGSEIHCAACGFDAELSLEYDRKADKHHWLLVDPADEEAPTKSRH